MINESEFGHKFEELRTQVLESCRMHELLSHDGETCMPERINLIAWLCHSIGVRSSDFGELAERLTEYQHQHNEKVGH